MTQPVMVHISGLRQTNLWFKNNKARTRLLMASYKETLAKAIQRKARLLIKERARYNRDTQIISNFVYGVGPQIEVKGRLAKSIHVIDEGTSTVRGRVSVIAMAPYAEYVEEGTSPHFIPFGLGRIEGVNHPGARGMHYMRDAVTGVIPLMREMAEESARAVNWFTNT